MMRPDPNEIGVIVECVKHDGKHKGVVRAQIGQALMIQWIGYVTVPRTEEECVLMRELSEDGRTLTERQQIRSDYDDCLPPEGRRDWSWEASTGTKWHQHQ